MISRKSILPLLCLTIIIIFGLFLRLKNWPQELTFGYEQARDAQAARSIFTEKKITLLGPTSEIEGVFHGPIYYYLIGLIYYLFGPNPAGVSLFHILVNVSGIPIIYFVGKKLFDRKVGLIAAALFAVSYEVISYSLWLSNPSPALPLLILAYFFFYQAFRTNHKLLPLAVFLLSLSVSFDLIIVVHFFAVIALYLIYNRKPIPWKLWIFSFMALILPLSNYPLFEIRHKFLMTNTIFSVLKGQDAELKSIFQYLGVYSNGLAKEFANVLLPIHGFFAGLLMIFLLYFLWQKLKSSKTFQTPWALLAVLLFANFPTFLISAAVTNSEFSFFGVNIAAILLTASLLNEILNKKKFILAFVLSAIVLLASIHAWKNYLPDPQRRLFDSQRGVILKDTLAAVNYTYQASSDKPFFVDAVTVPLYVSPLWDYLYSWQSKEKHYSLPTKDTTVSTQFLIIEPGWGNTYEIFKQKAIDHMNETTVVEETKKFGEITVQKRRLLK